MTGKRLIAVAATIALGSAAALIFAQQKSPTENRAAPSETFTGSSSKGIQPALDEAIQMGMKAHAGVADAMIEWELVKVTGRHGGIAGFNETSVTIRVTSGTPAAPARGR